MNNFLIIFCLILLSFNSNGQSDCREVESIVEDLIDGGYFKNSKFNTGLTTNNGIESDRQFLLYEELDRCASLKTLTALLKHESSIVVAYSWKSIYKKTPIEAFKFYLDNFDNLQKSSFNEFLNHCQGTVNKSLAQYMAQEISLGIKAGSINLKQAEIIAFKKTINSK